LTKKDIDDNPEDWKFAPILVETNAERMEITKSQAHLFAKHYETYVFKWRAQCRKWLNNPSPEEKKVLVDSNPFFWQYFVAGSTGYLNANICVQLGLANGTEVIYDSLVFQKTSTSKKIMELLEQTDEQGNPIIPFGSEIELDEPPYAVNVEIVQGLDGKKPTRKRQKQLDELQKFSIAEEGSNKIVIPIVRSTDQEGNVVDESGSTKWKWYKCQDPNNILSPLYSVQIANIFPIDLGFAMTVYKAQGRTIHRVILAFAHRPQQQMKFAAIFVGLSRVKQSEHLQLLYHQKKGESLRAAAERNFGYIEKLAPDKHVLQYYHGFDLNSGLRKWIPEKALQAHF
jgi:hypothetical protein